MIDDLPRPDAVIFDIGNVLIRWQPEEHYDRWIGGMRKLNRRFGGLF